MARKPDRRIGGFVNNYFVEAMIGWGGSSKVYRVRHADTLKHLAMKVISKPKSKIGYTLFQFLRSYRAYNIQTGNSKKLSPSAQYSHP